VIGKAGRRSVSKAAVAPLRVALDGAAGPGFHGELLQFGKVVPWR
jgi:hypothetical protein